MKRNMIIGAAVALAFGALAVGTAGAGAMTEVGYCEEPTVAEEEAGVRGNTGDRTPQEIRRARELYNVRRCATTLVPASESDAVNEAITDCLIAKGDTATVEVDKVALEYVKADKAAFEECIIGLGYVLKQSHESAVPLRHAKRKRSHSKHHRRAG